MHHNSIFNHSYKSFPAFLQLKDSLFESHKTSMAFNKKHSKKNQFRKKEDDNVDCSECKDIDDCQKENPYCGNCPICVD